MVIYKHMAYLSPFGQLSEDQMTIFIISSSEEFS